MVGRIVGGVTHTRGSQRLFLYINALSVAVSVFLSISLSLSLSLSLSGHTRFDLRTPFIHHTERGNIDRS